MEAKTNKPSVQLIYQHKISLLNDLLHHFNKQIRLFSVMRLIAFVLTIVFISLFATKTTSIYLLASVLSLVSMIFLILNHQKIYKKRDYNAILLRLQQNELNVLKGDENMYANGSHYASRLPFADDLDLFGAHSIYQNINRCSTSFGKDLLADAFILTALTPHRIQLLQDAVKELSNDLDFNQAIAAQLLGTYESSHHQEPYTPENFVKLFDAPWYRWASFLLPVLVISSFVYFIFTGAVGIFLLLGSASMLLAFSQNKKILLLSEEVSGIGSSLKTYNSILKKFSQRDNKAKILTEMAMVANNAGSALLDLATISEWFDRRSNLLLYSIGNVFFAYDFHLVLRYEKWKSNHLHQMPEWLQTTGRLEMLISLAIFSHNHPQFTLPVLSEQTIIKAKALGHPLIPPSKRVDNDVFLRKDPRIVLVTGSNMAGKSTWLRTLGVNILLAQAGAVVCAESFEWRPMAVLSSLRQTDSLHENTSLFMNELLQLKFILDEASKETPAFILLDEVLRGTNSDDKYSGSEALIRRLAETNSLVVMATHDLKLSKLESQLENKISNWCFESHIVEGKLLFDYKIHEGIAVNRNATWLMQDMGIIPKG